MASNDLSSTLISNPSTGHSVFGAMPKVLNSFEPKFACPGGDIVLPLGDVSRGLLHMRKHEDRILKAHGTGLLEHLAAVCSGYHQVYFQTRTDTYMLIKFNGVKSVIVAGFVEDRYQIITSYPTDRTINHKRRREQLIWTR